MGTFGANLRREREMRGVPLEEIAAATKISVRSLQALEAEEFSKLPGAFSRAASSERTRNIWAWMKRPSWPSSNPLMRRGKKLT